MARRMSPSLVWEHQSDLGKSQEKVYLAWCSGCGFIITFHASALLTRGGGIPTPCQVQCCSWVIQRWVKHNWCLQQGSNLVGGRLTNRSSHTNERTNERAVLSLCVSCSSSRRSIHAFSCPNKGVLQRCLTSPAASQVFSSWLFWWSLNMQFSNHPTLIQQLCLGEQWTHVKFRMSPRHDCGHFAMHHGSCPQGASSGRLAGTFGDPFLTGPKP